jgi:hypothetical protein
MLYTGPRQQPGSANNDTSLGIMRAPHIVGRGAIGAYQAYFVARGAISFKAKARRVCDVVTVHGDHKVPPIG